MYSDMPGGTAFHAAKCVLSMGCAAAVGWSPAEYVPRTAQGPLELIHRGFADQITIYIAIVVAAHALSVF